MDQIQANMNQQQQDALMQQQAMHQQAMQNAQQAANAQNNGQNGVQNAAADQPAQGEQGGGPILYNANHISRVKIPNFHGKPTEDVLLWADHFRQVAQVSGWTDRDAVIYAQLHMRDKAQQWVCGLDRAAIPDFASLYNQLVARFGESRLTLMTRLEHCKQGPSESIADFIDNICLLFAKTGYPAEGQAQKFMSGLNDKFRDRVRNTVPRSMAAAKEAAQWFEDTDLGSSPEKVIAAAKEKQAEHSELTEVTKGLTSVTKELGKLALTFTQNIKANTRDNGNRNSGSGGQGRPSGPIICHRCHEPGHKSYECPKRDNRPAMNHFAPRAGYGQMRYGQDREFGQPYERPQDAYAQQYTERMTWPPAPHAYYAQAHLFERQDSLSAADNIPANHEAEIYANAVAAGNSRRPVPFSPEQVNQRRAADAAARGAARGVSRGTAAAPLRRASGAHLPPHDRHEPPGMPSLPVGRHHAGFDIAREFANLKFHITGRDLIQQCPQAREDMLNLLNDVHAETMNADREHHTRQQTARVPSRSARPVPFNIPTMGNPISGNAAARTANAEPGPSHAPADTGPTPMETLLDTEVAYHSEAVRQGHPLYRSSASKGTSVVRAAVQIMGEVFDAIVDTGASNTAVSHSVVRQLGLMDAMIPSEYTYLTAHGASELPMGILPGLPVRLGNLTLNMDAVVTPADSYSVLVGNDWLRLAHADLLLSRNLLKVRMSKDRYEDIPIEADSGPRRLNTLQTQYHSTYDLPTTAQHLAQFCKMRSLQVEADEIQTRRFLYLPVYTMKCRLPEGKAYKWGEYDRVYDLRTAKDFSGFSGEFHDLVDFDGLVEYERALTLHLDAKQRDGDTLTCNEDLLWQYRHKEDPCIALAQSNTGSGIAEPDNVAESLHEAKWSPFSPQERLEVYLNTVDWGESGSSDADSNPDLISDVESLWPDWTVQRPTDFWCDHTGANNADDASIPDIAPIDAPADSYAETLAALDDLEHRSQALLDITNTRHWPSRQPGSPLPAMMAELNNAQGIEMPETGAYSFSTGTEPPYSVLPELNRQRTSLLPEMMADLSLAMEDSDSVPSSAFQSADAVLMPMHAQRDTSDWQFKPELFAHYDVRYGPFQIDATADNDGSNALCTQWWCPDDSCHNHSWASLKIWCNPPYNDISSILYKAMAGYRVDPEHTSTLLALPDWPDAHWWPTLTDSGLFHCVGYYPSGSNLFTAAPRGPQGQRRDMGPIRWGVVMAITGKAWGTGVCIPWTNWPPTHSPTIANVQAPANAIAPERPALNANLTNHQTQELEAVLSRFPDVWAGNSDTGRTNLVTHRIPTGNAAPIKARPHRMSQQELQISRENVQSMLESGTIISSKSSWSSAPVMVKKKDGGVRYCIDFRALNNVTIKDVYPIPNMEDVLDSLGNAMWFSKIDLKSGYWQIVVEPSDRHKTAFITREGLFEFVVMPFGLTSAPATFQRLMDTLLHDLLWHSVMVYLDDIIIYSADWSEHLAVLDEVLLRLRLAGLKASPGKCELAQEQLLYLGHLVTRQGTLPDPANIQPILDARPPTSVTAVKSFLGMTNYYANFIEGHSAIAAPIYRLLKKDVAFDWTEKCQDAFDILKACMATAPVLRRPDTSLPYLLHTDWSPVAIGAVLSQVGWDQEEHPIAYGSRLLHDAERNYAATEGECLAVVHFVEHWRPYLHGTHFIVEVDHSALRWLMTTMHVGKLARWQLKLSEYTFEIRHRPGNQHGNADAMSRDPVAPSHDVPMAVLATLIADVPDAQAYDLESDFDSGSPSNRADSADHEREILTLSGGDLGSTELQEPQMLAEDECLSGSSIAPELPCDICMHPDREEQMLVCDGCKHGFHIDCLQPPLAAVPEGSWSCPSCLSVDDTDNNTPEGIKDITEDLATVQYLQTGQMPAVSKREKARIRSRAIRFAWVNGQMIHKESGNPVPPVADRIGHIQSCHNIGHFGIAKTLNMVSNQFYWRGMTEQVKAVLLSCRACQTMRTHFNEPKELHPIAVKGVYNTVGIDLIGPLQRSLKGNRFIITCVDYLTKNVEARATPDKTSETVADFFWEEVICRHGNVSTVISDCGGELAGRFHELLERCFIDHRHTSPYHPQSNGLTERWNATLVMALQKMVNDNPGLWDTLLPTILMGYRGSMQAATRYSPFYLLHGYEMPLPVRAVHPIPGPTEGALGQAAQALLQNLQPLHEARMAAHSNIGQAQKVMKRKYARRNKHAVAGTDIASTAAPAVVAPTSATVAISSPAAVLPPVNAVFSTAAAAVNSAAVAQDKGKSFERPYIVYPDGTKKYLEETSCASAPAAAPYSSTPKHAALETAPRFIGQTTSSVDTPTKVVVSEPVLGSASGTAYAIPTAGAAVPTTLASTVTAPAARYAVQVGDFVVAKRHEKVRRDGNKVGKLATIVEGPFLLHSFTDETRQVAKVQDGNFDLYKYSTSHLSVYRGTQ